jgi:predicted dehydrogenase
MKSIGEMVSDRKLKGAVIGLGNIAFGSHIPTYLDQAHRVEIVAGCDKSPPNLERFSSLFSGASVYSSHNELFDAHEFDFIDICTPPDSHADLIEEAARRKIGVLCEKPLATTQDEMERIITTVTENRIVFVPCHQYRYSPQWQTLMSIIDGGKIGRPLHIHFEVLRCEPNPGNIHWMSDWRIVRSRSGGGITLDHGIHLFYLAVHLLGIPQKISATNLSFHHRSDGLEDTAWIVVEHDKGISKLDLTWASFQRRILYRVLGEKGEILLTEDALRLICEDGSIEEFDVEPFSKDSKHTGWFGKLIGDFLDRVERNKIEFGLLEEAANVLKCALSAYRSSSEGREVEFEPVRINGC